MYFLLKMWAFVLPLWAYVLVGFCPRGFCPRGFCPIGAFVLHSWEQKPIKNLGENGAWAYTGTAQIF